MRGIRARTTSAKNTCNAIRSPYSSKDEDPNDSGKRRSCNKYSTRFSMMTQIMIINQDKVPSTIESAARILVASLGHSTFSKNDLTKNRRPLAGSLSAVSAARNECGVSPNAHPLKKAEERNRKNKIENLNPICNYPPEKCCVPSPLRSLTHVSGYD